MDQQSELLRTILILLVSLAILFQGRPFPEGVQRILRVLLDVLLRHTTRKT